MIRLLTNEQLTNYFENDLAITSISDLLRSRSLIGRTLQLVKALRGADAYLGFNSNTETYLAGFLNKLVGGNAQMILWDTNLPNPRGLRGRILAAVKCFLFKWIDYFLCMHRNTAAYAKYYGIPRRKFRYIPFKANNYEMLNSISINDGGYILSCGASYRDFNCLLEAAQDIDFPIKIVMPNRSLTNFHNTFVSTKLLGLTANVAVIEHDMNKRSWNEYLSKATFVVIPIVKHCIQPAGISVYLEAMALGKPVIISRGTSTDQILDESMAMLFEPGNSKQLKECMLELLENYHLRERISEAGRKYALSLGGKVRLVKELERQVIQLVGGVSAPRIP